MINIREKIKDMVRNEIIEKGLDEFSVGGICPSDFLDICSSLGFDINNDNLDFNGWECDYWTTATKDGKKYDISGGAWYGDSRIYLSDEQEEDEED